MTAQQLARERFVRDMRSALLEYAGASLLHAPHRKEAAPHLANVHYNMAEDLVSILSRHWKPEERGRGRRSIP